MKSTLSKDIVFTYFSGHATSLQKKLIQSWLSEQGNAELYYEWLEEWERTQPHFLPDVNKAWEKNRQFVRHSITGKMAVKTGRKVAFRQTVLPVSLVWKIAVWILATGIGLYFIAEPLRFRRYTTSFAELRTITLDDNSRVVLNANSTLRIPRWGFGSNRRDVYLEGEAEFTVKKTSDQKTFTVHTNDRNKVTVLGTEFVVYTRDKGTRVILNKGKVELTPADESQPPLLLTPGDEASILPDGRVQVEKLTETQLEANSAWKEHRFVFDRTPLPEVGARLTETFGVAIRIADSTLLTRELTGSFPAQTLDEILDVLSEILDIEIVKKNKTLVFRSQSTSDLP